MAVTFVPEIKGARCWGEPAGPVSIGKPAPYLLEAAAHAVGREPSDAIMVGDGIGTDLAAARAVGARCVLMLTGVTTLAEVEALPVDQRPTAIAADAAELAGILDRLGPSPPARS